MMSRQIVLDTETTGIDPKQGHRIIEIGCVELVDRKLTGNHYHVYINPEREVDAGAYKVHGISNDFLADKPLFREITEPFIRFIEGAELIIHNAAFDVGFIDHEFNLLKPKQRSVTSFCEILDTLTMARKKHPGQKNNLDALCKRYGVDNSGRDLHGALLDSEILADVYLAMTGGQVSLFVSDNASEKVTSTQKQPRALLRQGAIPVLSASQSELTSHQEYLSKLRESSEHCVWDAWENSDP